MKKNAPSNVNCNVTPGSSAADGSSGNDKAIARLLYAMLKQRSLKDIDWNQVASDPVLLQEISNGHAARMRFSRFRNSVENRTKPRRNRLSAGSTSSTGSAGSSHSAPSSMTTFRVTKPKKESTGTKRSISQPLLEELVLKGVQKGAESGVKTEEQEKDSRDGHAVIQDMDLDTTFQSLPFSPHNEGFPRVDPTKKDTVSPTQSRHPLFVSPGLDCCPLTRSLSASSAAPEATAAQMLYLSRLTPCSDVDRQHAVTGETLALPADAFHYATAAAAAVAAASYHEGNGSHRGPPWMPPCGHAHHLHSQHHQHQHQHQPLPFSPPMAVYDIASDFCSPLLPQHQSLAVYGMERTGLATRASWDSGILEDAQSLQDDI